jgi:hypothetical protein
MAAKSVFTDELNQEAAALSTACAAIFAAGEGMWDDKHEGLYDRREAFTTRAVDCMIDTLSKFQFAHGINTEPLNPYFLCVLMEDEAVKAAVEPVIGNYGHLQQDAISDIFRNAGHSAAMKPLREFLGLSEMIDIQKLDTNTDFAAFDERFKAHFASDLGRIVKTSELERAIEEAINEPDANPFALRVFKNILTCASRSSVVTRVIFDRGVEPELLVVPNHATPATSTKPTGLDND